MLSEHEQALRDALAAMISTLDNVADTRREYCSGSTEAETWRAVEQGLTSDLTDLETMIGKAKTSVGNFWITP